MAKQPDQGWRDFVLGSFPKMEATSTTGTAGFTPATAADFAPITFRSDRSPDDAAALLPDAAATKMIALGQRAADLWATVPSHEQVQEVRLEAIGYKNRIDKLVAHRSEGGLEQDPSSAPQVLSEKGKLERAEKELARLVELKETRTVRWTAAGQLHQAARDWTLRGIPGGCTVDVVSDVPPAELLKKNEILSDGVERFRLRQRECAAERHRVNSQQWPISMAEAAAIELIQRRAEAGRPILENAIEHNLPISFATTLLRVDVRNVDAGPGTGLIEVEDAVGLVCWLFEKELLAKIGAGFREIGGDKNALDQQQRETMLATIGADSLSAERAECSLIWAAAERGEIIDFRATTSPACALGVQLRTLPRGAAPGTTGGHAFDIVGGGRR